MMRPFYVISLLLLGCSSADADSGEMVRVVVDSGADVRSSGGSSGTGGAGVGGSATGGAAASDSSVTPRFAPGADVARCEARCASTSGATWLGVNCDTDVDCCYANLVCEFRVNTTNGPLYVCAQRADCESDLDCPCNLVCVTPARRPEFPSASFKKCVREP
jgi:hypothetical protein